MDDFERLAFEAGGRIAKPAPAPTTTLTAEDLARALLKFEEQKRVQREKEAERERREWTVEYVQRSGVPRIFHHKRLDSFETKTPEQRAAVEACRQFLDMWADSSLEGEPLSLWFLGPPGTGKTRLASAIVTELMLDDGWTATLITPKRLIDRLRSTWGRAGKERESDVLQEFVEPDVLVLDDVGTGWATDADRVQIFEVIDLRYCACRPTLITSNLQPPQLRSVLGDRAYDRLRHGVRPIALTGESYRRPASSIA